MIEIMVHLVRNYKMESVTSLVNILPIYTRTDNDAIGSPLSIFGLRI